MYVPSSEIALTVVRWQLLTFVRIGWAELHDIRVCPEIPDARGRPEPERRPETPCGRRVRRGCADLYIPIVS